MSNALKELDCLLGERKVFLVAADVHFGHVWSDEEIPEDRRFVLYVGHTDEERKQFDVFMDREYDDGYGSQELFGTLWLSDDSWAERGEYDGSEWWAIRSCPKPPIKEK